MKIISLLILISAGIAQDVHYTIAFPNAEHHEAEISLEISNLSPGKTHFLMSRTSPGRYALHEFAKNVYHVKAFDKKGKEIKITRPNLHTWIVENQQAYVKLSYTLFANRADGTYSGINEKHAHLNIPATFMYCKESFDRAVTIDFKMPKKSNWKVASQLKEIEKNRRYSAKNSYYFMDSPIELSDFDRRSAKIGDQEIEMALHHNGSAKEFDVYFDMSMAVVHELIAVFGELPQYDYGKYTFIADYLPYVNGDGMEHRNSTILTSTGKLETKAMRLLGTVSHEFIHNWNVERIRPKNLEPFKFQEANMSDLLWFAEGFTSYYDDLAIHRAGLSSIDSYAKGITGGLNYVINSPARHIFSLSEMSEQAPFVDAARSIDPQNKRNTFISYYTWGAVLGLGLDLSLHQKFNKSLDAFMQLAWQRFGKSEKPYTIQDLENLLAEYTGSVNFARQFFAQYVQSDKILDYKKLLAQAGLLLRKKNKGKAWLGDIKLKMQKGRLLVNNSTVMNTPLYKAGLEKGDVIKSINSLEIHSNSDFKDIVESLEIGKAVEIVFSRFDEDYKRKITSVEDPNLEVIPFEHAKLTVSEEIKEFRSTWLGKKSQHSFMRMKNCSSCHREYTFSVDYCSYDGKKLSLF